MIENGRCKEHTGMEHEVANLKDTVSKQWTVISTMTTATMMKWVIGIFIIIAMSVVGFLWHGQVKLADSMSAGQEKILSEVTNFRFESTVHRNILQSDINVLKNDVSELKRARKRDDK